MIKLTNIMNDYDIDDEDVKNSIKCKNKYDFFYDNENDMCGSYPRGTYGISMIVFNKKTKKKYVCKKFFDRLNFSELSQEAALSELDHKNIPKLIDIYFNIFSDKKIINAGRDKIEMDKLDSMIPPQHKGCLFLIMEMIEGMTLYEAEPSVNYRAIFLKLIKALKYLHLEKSIVHGDLSIMNIIIDKKEKPYIIDFGFSINPYLFQSYQTLSYSKNQNINEYIPIGVVYGTAPIVAYKMVNGISLNIYDLMYNDINSLCATFYVKLTNKTPFEVRMKNGRPDPWRTREYILTDTYKKFVLQDNIKLSQEDTEWFQALFNLILNNQLSDKSVNMNEKVIKCIYKAIMKNKLSYIDDKNNGGR